jgi:hypothetical protein
MSLQSSQSRIEQAHKQLLRAWSDVAKTWQDQVAEKVQDQYIDPLRAPVNAAEERLQIMDNMLRSIRRECEIEEGL